MMLRIILGIILSVFIASGAQAQTGTPKPKPSLAAEIANCFPDNVVGAITPAVMRQCTLDFLASWQQYLGVNTQANNSYTVQLSDYGQMVLVTANGPVAITLPSAGTAGFTPFNFWVSVQGLGVTTITPTSGTINGVASFSVSTNQYALVVSDGTDWQVVSVSGGTAINIVGGPAGALGYYATAGTTISSLAPCSNGVYATTAGAVAQCVTTLPSALTYPSPVFTGTVTGPDAGTWNATGINTTVIGATVSANGTFANLAYTVMSPIAFQNSPVTITGLTANNSPDVNNDFIPYYNAADGLIRKVTVGSVTSAGVAGVSALNGLTGGVNIVGGDGMTISTLSPNITLNTTPSMPGGRLTLLSGTPVMTASTTGATSIYYDCFHGANRVPVFDGTFDVELPIGSCEISTAMTAGAGVSQILSANVFDVWGVAVTGVLHICIATDAAGHGWIGDTGSNTARGSGYSVLDATTRPYITNKNALTHCYEGSTDRGSIAVNQATYLGTFYSTANGQTAFQFGAAPVTNTAATPGLFGLWNAYNRVNVVSRSWPGTSSWNYAVATWRQTNASAAVQTQFVIGLSEDGVTALINDAITASTTGNCEIGIGVDSTSSPAGASTGVVGASNTLVPASGMYTGYPGVGLHTLAGIERASNGGSTCTYFGSNLSDSSRGGITFNLRM